MNYRNYDLKDFSFSKPTTVFVGHNAIGKTNILEAIYLLATGDSFRADKIEEMVNWGVEVGHVGGKIGGVEDWKPESMEDDKGIELQVTLTRGMVQGKRVHKRKFQVNGVGKRKKDFVGQLKAIAFTPDDMRLLTGSKSRRRKFLDEVLLQLDSEYVRALGDYDKALKQKNALLSQIHGGFGS